VKPTAQSDITAQVVLRSASGKRLDPSVGITSANIREYLPSSEAEAFATGFFRSAGFQIGPTVGNNFAITAPAETFETVFGVNIKRNADGTVLSIGSGGGASLELPLSSLPALTVQFLEWVTFTRRMELH